MKYLAIDTSGAHLTVVARNEEKEKSIFVEKNSEKHSVLLMSAIESCLSETCLSLRDVDFFACVVGAGSFTGIRIGVSTVKALCLANRKKCLAITSFDVLAYNKQGGKYIALLDAGHNNFYLSAYADLKVEIPPCFVSKEELTNLQKEYKILCSFENDFGGEIVDLVQGLKTATERKAGELIEADELMPLYVKKSQAEENL